MEMRVAIDTNILLDVLLENRPHKTEAEQILSAASKGLFQVQISTQSLIDASYIAKKHGVDFASFSKSVNHLRAYLKISAIDWIDLSWALTNHSGDFEDDAQYANAYNSVCDMFITRNKRLTEFNDDPLCPMTVISPEDFVAAMMAED